MRRCHGWWICNGVCWKIVTLAKWFLTWDAAAGITSVVRSFCSLFSMLINIFTGDYTRARTMQYRTTPTRNKTWFTSMQLFHFVFDLSLWRWASVAFSALFCRLSFNLMFLFLFLEHGKTLSNFKSECELFQEQINPHSFAYSTRVDRLHHITIRITIAYAIMWCVRC